MAEHKDGRMIETPIEARQAEPEPSVSMLLIVSVDQGRIWLLEPISEIKASKEDDKVALCTKVNSRAHQPFASKGRRAARDQGPLK
jgi:hypothetical protein